MTTELTIRAWRADDSLDELTDLLHRAYAPLGAMGLNFTAVDQSVEETTSRVGYGTCFVAVQEGKIVGTVTVEPPYSESTCHYYRNPWVVAAHQFAVEPELQRTGLGARLLHRAEEWAAEKGYSELAIDTAEPAIHLVEYYRRRDFDPVDRVQWHGKTYKSIVLRKILSTDCHASSSMRS